jgi:aryl-alcohol dehydrogenase-like predicted oxidoreductase
MPAPPVVYVCDRHETRADGDRYIAFMRRRTLGRTGLSISEVGYGGWGIGGTGWIGADDEESKRALHRAIDLGLRFIDTAWAYGQGHSEVVIGEVVRDRAEQVVVATKVPAKQPGSPAELTASEAFPGSHVREFVDKSLRNLGVETIDLLQLHRWWPTWLDDGDWLETLSKLKSDGKIRFFGLSLADHRPATGITAVRSGLVDTVQVIYNIFDQSAEAELFPACVENGVGVIVRVPFDEGGLTGTITADTAFPEGDWRHKYFSGDRKREVQEHAQAIVDDLGLPLERLPEIALRFVLSNPAVSTVIPGMRSVRNVERNIAVADGVGLPDSTLDVLRKHSWERNFYP